MLQIRSASEMERVIASALDPNLRRLLALRRDQLSTDDLEEQARFLIVEPGDGITAVATELGVELGGDPGWEWSERHTGWTELVFILTDDGFAHVLLVPDRDDIDPHLLALGRDHA